MGNFPSVNSITLANAFTYTKKRLNLEWLDCIPLSIFANDKLSSLEAIVKYFVENIGATYRSIAKTLNRDERTIWDAYSNAAKKMPSPHSITPSAYLIPVSAFRNRKLGVLEVLSTHLKDEYNLKYSQIAPLLRRDQRTIWTAYQRARRKKNAAA